MGRPPRRRCQSANAATPGIVVFDHAGAGRHRHRRGLPDLSLCLPSAGALEPGRRRIRRLPDPAAAAADRHFGDEPTAGCPAAAASERRQPGRCRFRSGVFCQHLGLRRRRADYRLRPDSLHQQLHRDPAGRAAARRAVAGRCRFKTADDPPQPGHRLRHHRNRQRRTARLAGRPLHRAARAAGLQRCVMAGRSRAQLAVRHSQGAAQRQGWRRQIPPPVFSRRPDPEHRGFKPAFGVVLHLCAGGAGARLPPATAAGADARPRRRHRAFTPCRHRQ